MRVLSVNERQETRDVIRFVLFSEMPVIFFSRGKEEKEEEEEGKVRLGRMDDVSALTSLE